MPSRQSKLVFALAGGVLVVILAAIAVAIANSQSSDRSEIAERFVKRPEVSAALVSALFSATSTTPKQQRDLARRFGGLIVSKEVLTAEAKRSNNVFKAVVDNQGNVLGVSAGAPRASAPSSAPTPTTSRRSSTATSRSPSPTSSTSARPAPRSQLFAQAIETEYGRRVLITGFAPGSFMPSSART